MNTNLTTNHRTACANTQMLPTANNGKVHPMNFKRGALLIIALLALLSHGCAIETSSVPLDLIRPSGPSFTQDSSPAPPNYYWMNP